VRRWFTACLLASLALAAAAARSTDYRIAADRSHADFAVRLLWLHTIDGRFMQIAGQVWVDSHGLATVDARIAVNSVVMDSARFRRWMLAPEFFDAAQYPIIHFVSVPVPLSVLSRGGVLDGRLSLRGTTRPIRFELMPSACGAIAAGDCVIAAHGSLSRGEFGMNGHRATLSDQVQLGLRITLDPATD
jgi:polyisoprenoid-binding protein YceI